MNLNSFSELLTDGSSIMDAIPFPVCLFDLSGKLQYANQSGKNLYKKLPKSFFSSEFKQVQNHSKTLLGHSLIINYKKYILTATPIYENGKAQAILAFFEDFSIYQSLFNCELERYQTTIDDLQAIFDNSYDVLYVSDGNGKTLRASSACETLWGKKPEELIGRSVYELEREGVYNPSATRIALEQGKKIQIIQHTKTGRRLAVVSTPIRDIKGNITRVVNASRDITEVQELEEELKQMKIMIEGYRKQLSAVQQTNESSHNKLIYRSKSMAQIVSMLSKVASVDSTVLITGESGVGKEVIANYIHTNSFRESNPFIKINCAAIPESLLESELFGYEQGAFTGANKRGKAGLFELANEGTLFLDEIGDMPLNLQAKLLRVFQEGEIMRVGGQKPVKINVRIITATNQDLQSRMKENRFREDLYYRLSVIPVKIPPLRDRREDIVPLIQHFLTTYSDTFHEKKSFSRDVLNLLEKYSWPGNVRELQNVVERLVVTSDSQEIRLHNIPEYIMDSFKALDKQSRISRDQSSIEIHDLMPLKDAVTKVESKLLEKAAQECSNFNEMAQRLGVNQSTISRKMQKYGLSK